MLSAPERGAEPAWVDASLQINLFALLCVIQVLKVCVIQA